MPATRTPPARWVEEGLRALAVGGPEAVRIEPLAQALGVTKGGFYGYFSDRRALLEEMLDAWEQSVIDEVIEHVEGEGGDARARLRRLFALTSSSAGELLRVELAIRDWARRDKAVAKRLKRVDNRRMEFMRALFADFCRDGDDVEARCLLAFSLFIGSAFITTDHDGRSRADVVEQALEWLVS
ncbi:MAG TPA: TetR/AcrR family transcriptional regulator [Solirubrobacterales bacterium]|nr:TetR/AcrR family transcriptional regulator [Solirubrobacterales bacterium]